MIVLLSHCLLNQRTRAEENFTPRVTRALLKLLSSYPVWLEQLPCPEFLFLGRRKRKDYEEWEKEKGFRPFCRRLTQEVVFRIFPLVTRDRVAIITVARSPSCAGVFIKQRGKVSRGKGIFIQELEKLIKIEPIEFDFKDVEGSLKRLEEWLRLKVSDP